MNQNKLFNGEFCWSELATNHVKEAQAFYGDLLNWTFKDITTEQMTYTLVMHEGREIAGMWEIPKDQETNIFPHWLSYILIKDIEHHVEKARKLGAIVQVPVTKAGEFGHFAILTDPTGANFAFWEPMDKENVAED